MICCLSISGAPDTKVTKACGIFSESTMLNNWESIGESLSTSRLSWDWSSRVQYISNHARIERLSKRYRFDVSYPKTQLTYSSLTRRIQATISSLMNEVQAHPRSTLLSSVIISDMTPHAYSIQWLILTMQALIIHIWSHSRHASEPRIPTLHYLWICGCQHTECHLSDTKLVGAGAAHPARSQRNLTIYAWSVCEGRHLNALTVILHVNLSFAGSCPWHD